METIEQMEEVYIYSDVSGQRPLLSSCLSCENIVPWTSFLYKPLCFSLAEGSIFIYKYITNKTCRQK